MEAVLRRKQILERITKSETPISASLLAKNLNVSRQVVVGDIALLRAQGNEIIATARGYMIPEARDANQYLGRVACKHSPEDTKAELYIIVDLGAVILNVIVGHELYGEMTGQLNLKSREDVDVFIDRVNSSEVKLLSELTMGVHLHTISCNDKSHFEEVYKALEQAGYLFKD